MKSAARKQRSVVAKSSGKPATVDEYIARIPEQSRAAFKRLHAAVLSAIPKDATETISYGIPAIRQRKVVVWFAAFSDHCSLFPTAAIIEEFKDDLKTFSTSKGTIHFPNDKPVPVPLVRKLVKAWLRSMAASVK